MWVREDEAAKKTGVCAREGPSPSSIFREYLRAPNHVASFPISLLPTSVTPTRVFQAFGQTILSWAPSYTLRACTAFFKGWEKGIRGKKISYP